MAKKKVDSKKSPTLACPLCKEPFEDMDKLVDHIREKSISDRNHELLLNAYYALSANMDSIIQSLFQGFIKGIISLGMEVKKMKKLRVEDIEKIVEKIKKLLKNIPKPTDPLGESIYESVVSKITNILSWRHRTKTDLLRILSSIKSIFSSGKKTYNAMILKAAMILQEYFIRV